jgi:hypothetical protein
LELGEHPVYHVFADDAAPTKAFSIYWENDVFTGTDRDYSNGLKLSWSKPYTEIQSADRSIGDRLIARLPGVNDVDSNRSTSFSIGQSIFTPKDTKSSELILDDRPYAGFSYIGVGVYSDMGLRRDVWELNVGVIGPLSLAEQTQNITHDIIKTGRAAGWEHQIANELGIAAVYETKWRLWQAQTLNGFGVELIPHLGGSLGNIAIFANTGAELRFGWYLPNNFGTCPIRPGCDVGNVSDPLGNQPGNRIGTHFFIAVDGRAVLHNIFLDGNTFKDSHSVEKEPFVADLMGGIALNIRNFHLSYAYILRSKEFKSQDSNHGFGAIRLTYFF